MIEGVRKEASQTRNLPNCKKSLLEGHPRTKFHEKGKRTWTIKNLSGNAPEV